MSGRSVCALVAATNLALFVQQPPPPAFRAGVDILSLEASVVDDRGQPVANLQPSDFVAKVDGKPRRVISASFYGAVPATTIESMAPPLADVPGHASNQTTAFGRTVVLVIDQESIRSGSGRTLLDTASRLLDALSPADAVGLLGLPGIYVELTRDHERVRQALAKIAGTEPRPPWEYYVSIEEAIAIVDRNDQQVFNSVIERECKQTRDPMEARHCRDALILQSRQLVTMSRQQLQRTMTALTSVADKLRLIRGPKEMVLISGGIPYEDEWLFYYRDFARKAAEAQIVMYTVHLDQAALDASEAKPIASPFSGREMTQGLMSIASMTGGSYFGAVGRAGGIFTRIAQDLNNFYLVGVEATPSDADGKLH